MLGLSEDIRACLFDLDGVLTQTAKVHAAAWKQTFDDYLRARAGKSGEDFKPFDLVKDYEQYVDGKPRYEGVSSFLDSRGITLPDGDADDKPDAETIHGLGNRKNELVLKMIHDDGVEAYEGSVRYVESVRAAGLKTAVVSSSSQLPRCPRGSRDHRPLRRDRRRRRRRARAPRRQARSRHVPARGPPARHATARLCRLRGRARRR